MLHRKKAEEQRLNTSCIKNIETSSFEHLRNMDTSTIIKMERYTNRHAILTPLLHYLTPLYHCGVYVLRTLSSNVVIISMSVLPSASLSLRFTVIC